MKIDLKQKVNLSTYEQGDYTVKNMPAITAEIQRLAEEFIDAVLLENLEIHLQPTDENSTISIVIEAGFNEEIWPKLVEIPVVDILNECLDWSCVQDKDTSYLIKVRDALQKNVDLVNSWLKVMEKND